VQTDDKEKLQFLEADNELFKLLYPYQKDLQDFRSGATNTQTETLLESAPNPSVQGQYVTFTAAVRFVATKAPVSQGDVSFNMHTGPDVRMIQPKVARYGVVLQQLGRQPISNGVATLRTNMLPKGIIRVTATFPGSGAIPGSNSGEPLYDTGLGQEVT
jgi:hypothetical protein